MNRLGALVALASLLVAAVPGPTSLHAALRPRAAAVSVHVVKPGDTLSAVAARHGVTVAALVKANRLPSAATRIRIGQRLTIPSPPVTVAEKRAGPAPANGRMTSGSANGRSTTVSVSRRSTAASPNGRRAVAAVNGRRAVATVPRSAAVPQPSTLVMGLPDFSDLVPLFAWPVDGQVSSTFGRRRSGWHQGIDIKADLGTPITAAAAGVVIGSGFETRYGRVVKIEHLNGFITLYAHNDENKVEPGDRVTMGQVIAVVGKTGHATAHHVHFEIRQGGRAYNPLYMLPLPPRVTHVEEGEEDESEELDE